MTQNEIRAAMNVTSPNVTYLIDELEKEGLVHRVPNPGDRRATLVELTAGGSNSSAYWRRPWPVSWAK